MDKLKPFAPTRIGLKEHHPHMTFAEIAVFQHLLLGAIRTPQLAAKRGHAVGFVEGATGNRIADEMGKSRDAIQRALRGLEWNEKTKRRYITRTPMGVQIHNFDGTEYSEEAGRNVDQPGFRPAGKQADPGRKTGRPRPENRPTLRKRTIER